MVVAQAMAMLIRNVGRYVVPFAQEILNHLNVHFFLSPKVLFTPVRALYVLCVWWVCVCVCVGRRSPIHW
jgi:hypothetical protein